jgi:hypothetical protein
MAMEILFQITKDTPSIASVSSSIRQKIVKPVKVEDGFVIKTIDYLVLDDEVNGSRVIDPEDPCRSSDGTHYETCWSCGHDVQDCMCDLDEDEDDGSLDDYGG